LLADQFLGKDSNNQSFALGNQSGDQSLVDETDDHATQTQVRDSQEEEEVPQDLQYNSSSSLNHLSSKILQVPIYNSTKLHYMGPCMQF
jgi:K+-transporting ATPase c subunit